MDRGVGDCTPTTLCALSRLYGLPVARPGAFAANFEPDVLDRFRSLCKAQGRQYTKVLEQFAILYLESNGTLLDTAAASKGDSSKSPDGEVKDLKKKVTKYFAQHEALFDELIQRIEKVEEKVFTETD